MTNFGNNTISFEPIGVIHTEFKEVEDIPIHPFSGKEAKGYIELLPKFEAALKDLEGFTHITLIYYLHKAEEYELEVTPYIDTEPHGVFATRVAARPNPIGLSTVRLENIKGNIINITELDIMDGTPLLDIKPYYKLFDNRMTAVSGWLENIKDLSKAKAPVIKKRKPTTED